VKKQARIACLPSYRRAPLRMLERGILRIMLGGVRARSERPLFPTRLLFAQTEGAGRHAPDRRLIVARRRHGSKIYGAANFPACWFVYFVSGRRT
jgi:hypothetical protein